MSEDREKVQMYDDGSNSFKLLWHELKDVKDVIVHDMKDDLLETFTKADAKIKSYLHYTNEELTKGDEALRKEVEKVERVGFKNNVVLAYEGMDNKTVDERYNQLPGNAEDCEICRGTGKKEQFKVKDQVPEGAGTEGIYKSITLREPTGRAVFNKDGTVDIESVREKTQWKEDEEVEGRAKRKKFGRSVV